jgi:hypothetical protein
LRRKRRHVFILTTLVFIGDKVRRQPASQFYYFEDKDREKETEIWGRDEVWKG